MCFPVMINITITWNIFFPNKMQICKVIGGAIWSRNAYRVVDGEGVVSEFSS